MTTFMVQEVVLCFALGFAIITKNVAPKVFVFGRHLVLIKHPVDLLKVMRHIGQRFPANRTLVAVFNMLLITFPMNAMATRLKSANHS
jgi:hypothetical protein